VSAVPGLEIVEDETGVRDEFSAAGHRSLHVLARPQRLALSFMAR